MDDISLFMPVYCILLQPWFCDALVFWFWLWFCIYTLLQIMLSSRALRLCCGSPKISGWWFQLEKDLKNDLISSNQPKY